MPIDLPMAAGEPARYHLLADFFGAQVSLLGISLHSALAVTSGFLALFFPAIAYCCGVRLVGGRWAAVLGVVIFCAGGTLGFVHLVGDLGDQGWRILWELPRDYSRDPDSLLWMDNPSLSYLHAQRNGLFGLPLGLVALTVLRCGVEERRPAAFATAGVLVGAVPLANGFAFVVPMAIDRCVTVRLDPRHDRQLVIDSDLDGGTLRIDLRYSHGMAEMTFTDTGIVAAVRKPPVRTICPAGGWVATAAAPAIGFSTIAAGPPVQATRTASPIASPAYVAASAFRITTLPVAPV